MMTLDMDFNRANQFPLDYETDLESEWANPSKLIQFSVYKDH